VMRAASAPARAWRELPHQPRWVVGLAVGLVFAACCVLLAQWQWHRKEVRDQRNATITANYDLGPAPLAAVLSAGGVTPADEWRPVTLTGRYDAAATVLVRNRPQGGANGYLVSVPLVLERAISGRSEVWLVRGWIPAGQDAATAPTPQQPPAGRVDVVARLRPAEPRDARVAAQGQAYRLDPAGLARSAGREAGQAVVGYGLVSAEDPLPAGSGVAPLAAPKPAIDPGPHLAYTIQWYLFAVAGLAIWGVLYRRPDDTDAAPTPAAVRTRRPATDRWTYSPGGDQAAPKG